MQRPAATSTYGATHFISPWLTTDQAADYLSVSVGTLYNWRSQGRGPRYNTVGRIVRYHRDQLDAFLHAGAA
jgi:excisionase family DNA binding protein